MRLRLTSLLRPTKISLSLSIEALLSLDRKGYVMKTISKDEIIDRLVSCCSWLAVMGSTDTAADAGRLIGKTKRTVEAYRARSDERSIPAGDLMTLYIQIIKRFAPWPRGPIMPITVFDQFGQPSIQVQSVFAASFLADIEGGSWQVENGCYVVPRTLPDATIRKSRLRRLLWSKAVTSEEACAALECDEYYLVIYQIEGHFEERSLSVPAAGLLKLEALAAERLGEAA